MSLHNGYLTNRQFNIWNMLREGLSQSEIARRLNITRQAVNQMISSIPEKITMALMDAAKLNRIEPRYIDNKKGILFGWSIDFQTEVIIALNSEGLQIWYQHNLGNCKICPNKRECKRNLLKNAKNLGITLKWRERRLSPSKLSSLIFSKIKAES
ncbi:response regulator transcription factor [Candidatus Bathyarchaeota archaeon]|nr:response regulator transcription factor [Candidatus Bathyarchaeota archaeon]